MASMLRPQPCPRVKCDCFIGYAHRDDLPFRADFGDGLPVRIPIRNGVPT